MSKFESSVRQIDAPQQKVYATLSDLRNLQLLKDRFEELKAKIPADELDKLQQLKDLTFDADSISITAPMIGAIKMVVVERDEPKTIKFASENSPVPLTFWIQLLPITDTTSKMRLTVDADVPFFLKSMVQKPLGEGIEKVAEALSMIPYNTI